MNRILFPKRFSLLKSFAFTFLAFSFLIRILLYVKSFSEIDFSIVNMVKLFAVGLFMDLGSLSYFLTVYTVYLLIIPAKFYGSKLDKIFTKSLYALFLFIIIFSFLAEITFWDEYQKRFNFIAVDYLLYTYEVIGNIHQSYPLPLLIGGIILLTYGGIKAAKKANAYENTFQKEGSFKEKIVPSILIFSVFFSFHLGVNNTDAEVFENNFENELAKAGVYSFFAAYQSNELNYYDFYLHNDTKTTYQDLRKLISVQGDSLLDESKTIRRKVINSGLELKPNVVFIGLESLNATFMKTFGSEEDWTPNLEKLANESVFFTNLYAVGTRTVRGMEGITLCIAPTPGRSILKRKNNNSLFNIGTVFKEKGYTRTFFYGGDGFFDNLNLYFGNNGYDIVDRKKSYRFEKQFSTKRTHIEDSEVTFENAWGVCDEDIYNKLLKVMDEQHETKKPFFNFVMNNSNHQPYTYPDGKIAIPSGTSREGAVRYADFALREFFKKAKNKPWFKNTVFVLMSDHCAYSAGRTELNVESYHIPAMIYNLPETEKTEVNALCSQIDLFPTLFGYLNWTYTSALFGQDIRKMNSDQERAFIGNYRKLGLLKKAELTVLGAEKDVETFQWNLKENTLVKNKPNKKSVQQSIVYYQTAYDLFTTNGLKEK